MAAALFALCAPQDGYSRASRSEGREIEWCGIGRDTAGPEAVDICPTDPVDLSVTLRETSYADQLMARWATNDQEDPLGRPGSA